MKFRSYHQFNESKELDDMLFQLKNAIVEFMTSEASEYQRSHTDPSDFIGMPKDDTGYLGIRVETESYWLSLQRKPQISTRVLNVETHDSSKFEDDLCVFVEKYAKEKSSKVDISKYKDEDENMAMRKVVYFRLYTPFLRGTLTGIKTGII